MTAAVRLRLRAELRRRWRAWLGLALIVGLAGAAVLALLAGARRTESAYGRFLESQRAFDVLVSLNTSGFGAPTEETFDVDEIAGLPDVVDTAETGSFFVTVGAGVGVLVPPDERIGTTINRFKMLEGRPPDPDDATEVVIGFEVVEQYGLGVGDTIPVIDPIFFEEPDPELSAEEVTAVLEARERVLETLPDNALTIVGIEASPGEFPPQIEGTGRYLIHASPALFPLRDDIALFSEGSDLLMVRLEGGARGTDAFVRELERLGAREGVQLTIQRELTASVDRSLRTQADALRLLALLTALVGAVAVGQALARLTLVESAEHPVLASLGMSRRELVGLGVARTAAIGAAGAAIAVVLGAAVSPLFPTGLAGIAEPDPGLRLDALVLGPGALAILGTVLVLAAWPAWRAARSVPDDEAAPARPSLAARVLAGSSAPVPVGVGVRMALEPGQGPSAVPVRSSLAGVTLGVLTLVAAVTFGASLAHLLDTPRLYGQTWDVELTTYDESLTEDGVDVLADDERVDGLASGTFRASFSVGGHRTDGIVLDEVRGGLTPSIVEGRHPRGEDEIALGARTLREVEVDVGDTVEVAPFATNRAPTRLRVVGRAVFPVFGEVGRLGDGAYVDVAAWERVLGEPLDVSDTGLLLRLAPGASVDAVVADLGEAIGNFVFVLRQGRPTDIVNFGRVDGTPYFLGAVLAVLSFATLTHLLISAVRRRRHDLAILKTLGFVKGQVRGAVAAQATALIAVALLVALPVGAAVGRWAWILFAEGLGVVVEPEVPVLVLGLIAVAAIVVANLLAVVPAQLAARTRPAAILRAE